MDKKVSNDSVFSLITNLCERSTTQPSEVKLLRSKCFEYLLGKKEPIYPKFFRDVKGTNDPYIKLLCWNFTLSHDFQRGDLAEKLQNSVDSLKECYREDVNSFNNILQFLLNLRSIPPKDNDKFDLSELPEIDDLLLKYDDIFNLGTNLTDEDGTYIVDLRPSQKLSRTSCSQSKITIMTDFAVDEGYFSPTKDNIWEIASEIASKSECLKRRTWENFGYAFPEKEKPFLSELGEVSSLWVENLYSLYPRRTISSKLMPNKVFLNDIKQLLVGISSNCFKYSEKKGFYLENGVTVEGIAPDTLEIFCKDLMFCGNCYKALEKISVPDPYTRRYKHPGYIFKEFCMGINRYLQFYRTAVFNIPNSTHFLTFYEKLSKVQMQIKTLTSLCKVGPYTTEEIPHGVALLNYLYQKVLTLTDDNILNVLYSILYPCCQVYFRQFLQQWILEGSVNDQYGEFFIAVNTKYIHTRGRTYWTRSFSICEDIVPDFLLELKNDILFCGKIMNLLKLCIPSSKFNVYLRGKKPLIFSCCLSQENLQNLQQNATTYYLDASFECGSKFSLNKVIDMAHEQDPVFLQLIAKKRAITLKRLELERQKIIQERNEKKSEELMMLKEQYDAVLEQKQMRILREIEKEMKTIEENMSLEIIREKLIQDESQKMIEHYTKLSEFAEIRKAKIDKHIQLLSSIHLEDNLIEKDTFKSVETMTVANESSNDSFYSVVDDNTVDIPEQNSKLHSSDSLDILNANTDTQNDENIQQALDNFELAKRNKYKVLTEEMGMEIVENIPRIQKNIEVTSHLTAAQRNKLKVLSSEFGIPFTPDAPKVEKILTAAQINRNRVLGVHDCFKVDNENYVNRNITKSKSLTLDFSKPKIEKVTPMSVDSTPMSEVVSEVPTTPSTFLSIDTAPFSSIPQTAETQNDSEGFDFNKPSDTSLVPIYINNNASTSSVGTKKVFSKRVTPQEASNISNGCLNLFLKESIKIPLLTQLELANGELLKYFVEDLKYLEHLQSLRRYFFLQDGEFGRNITENLYDKLYNATFPKELINCRILHQLVYGAFYMSKNPENSPQFLSFKINKLPKQFDLRDPDVLDCISLTYKVQWPLNILLPTDTITKYEEIFRYLLKLNRVSWVLKSMFLELKTARKIPFTNEACLISSPEYKKIQQWRHNMTHFIQTLQNYVMQEVLQPSWNNFEKSLRNVNNLDEVYVAHTTYIKNILFMCLLNQKTAALYSVIQKIFIVILKFQYCFKSKYWKCRDGYYVHVNFLTLERIFKNFEELVFYLFKVGRKIAKSGYPLHFIRFLDALNINGYYDQTVG